MELSRQDRFSLLQLFADGKAHTWWETINLGVRFLKVHQYTFEAMLQQAMNDELIRREDSPTSLALRNQKPADGCIVAYLVEKQDWNYILTAKGDKAFREEKIIRDGDTWFYNNYDRSLDGKFGVNKYAPLPKNLQRIDDN
jgi:hypothetical protein